MRAMIVEATPLPGVMHIRPEPAHDSRGHFSRLWCEADFAAAGLVFRPTQISASFNHRAGTLRGLHWQAAPYGETKLVRASRGRVFDVAVDLRPEAATWRRWFGVELDAERMDALLIPAGFAHGFITLTDGAEVTYCIDIPFVAAAGRGARFDDPAFAVAWPRPPAVISDRDLAWPAFRVG
jgi:dTDP-4-dehydrorhamnose 3,5-epimerase